MREVTRHISLALLLLVLLSIFIPTTGSSSETFVLTGQIMDIDGKPVTGAELFVYDSAIIRRPADFISARTGQDGRYSLILPRQKFWAVARVRSGDKFGPLLPGDRHSGEALLLEPDDNAKLQQDFTVVNILEAVRQKQKVRTDHQNVTGKILDQHGKPVVNAYVFAQTDRIVRGVPEYISAWSDESGIYSLYLPSGSYFLGASVIFPPVPGSAAKLELLLESVKKAFVQDIIIDQKQLPLPAILRLDSLP